MSVNVERNEDLHSTGIIYYVVSGTGKRGLVDSEIKVPLETIETRALKL